MPNRETIFISYSESFGLLVNSNAGPNGFVKQMLEEFLSEPTHGKELTLAVAGREVVFTEASELKAYPAALKRVRPIAQKREDVIAALKQADDTLSWAQHFINHADRQSIPATIEQIRSVLAAIQ